MKPIYLKEARVRAGLTQEQLEAAASVPQPVISKLERDPKSRPSYDTFEKLDSALRKCGALKRTEKLVFGQREAMAS